MQLNVNRFAVCASVALSVLGMTRAPADEPVAIDPRLQIELFAEDPQLVTPTGIDVDSSGRVWVIESNTHFPPEGYQGHPSDRILILADNNHDGKAESVSVFRDGLTHAMSIIVEPEWLRRSVDKVIREPSALTVYIATRRAILQCTDSDGDLQCDEVTQIVRLETPGNYPHNGLGGFAFDAMGHLYFGFGENLGAEYKVIGSDGQEFTGGAEGGSLFRCEPDGSQLLRWATGFWNPHASCVDAFGRMFTVDNDPDSRPPCRLLHIIQDGDYGYRFRNGRKGTHPFTAWNGEIPGTLPMVSGTGEAPSGILSYESGNFPADYTGTLLVGSWGDHRIDRFVLRPQGSSFVSFPEPIIRGDEEFRPVGLAVGPDGALYCTDWVKKDYNVHGKGRVWKISSREPKTSPATAPDESLESLTSQLRSVDLKLRRSAAARLSTTPEGRQQLLTFSMSLKESESERSRIEAYWAIVRVAQDDDIRNELLTAMPGTKRSATEFRDELDIQQRLLRRSGVLKSKQHRIAILSAHATGRSDPTPEFDRRIQAAVLSNGTWSRNASIADVEESMAGILVSDPFLLRLRALQFSRVDDPTAFQTWWHQKNRPTDVMRLVLTLAQRIHNPKDTSLLDEQLRDESLPVRRAAVQWVGEESLNEFRPAVEECLASEPMTSDLIAVCLATLALLDGQPAAEFEKAPPASHMLPIVLDPNRPALLRAMALRMLPAGLPELNAHVTKELLAANDSELPLEAVRSLQHSTIAERESLLLSVVTDENRVAELRLEAIAALPSGNHEQHLSEDSESVLLQMIRNENPAFVLEALRSLRSEANADGIAAEAGRQLRESIERLTRQHAESKRPLLEALSFFEGQRPTAESVVRYESDAGEPGGSPDAGRRFFFHVHGAGCHKCHSIGGRGGHVGPDLTVIARTMNRKKLAQSVLYPGREISPQFTQWAIETVSGKVIHGMLLGEEVNGDVRIGDNQGQVHLVPFREIVSRTPMTTSVMPERLHQLMTLSEFSDLLSFLETLR